VASGANDSAGSTMAAPEAMQAMLPITIPKQWYRGTGMHTLQRGAGRVRGVRGGKAAAGTSSRAGHEHEQGRAAYLPPQASLTPPTGQLKCRHMCG
jgi:hypothetical protein